VAQTLVLICPSCLSCILALAREPSRASFGPYNAEGPGTYLGSPALGSILEFWIY
jgi:hypothetical protein